MKRKQTICIAEDHTILREGLRALLSSNEDFEVICEAQDGLEVIQCVQKHLPSILLLDISMPRLNGLEAIGEIKKRWPETKILVLTMHNIEEYILAALESGADGYLLKGATQQELMTAIKTVLAGKTYLSPDVSEKVIHAYLEGKKATKPGSSWENLTHREREILKLIAEGYKNKEIAECLHMSIKTVETHRAHLMKKLDLHSASALTTYAIERRLVVK